jgi:outer membrane assembly lipoprotein YfiO
MQKYIRIAMLVALAVGFGGLDAYAQWTWTPQTGRWVNLKRLPKETPQLQIEYARSLMLEGEYSKAWRETNKFVNFYEDSELRDDNQFLRGEIRMAQGKWMDGAKEFQTLISSYPDTDHYDEAIQKQYEIGDHFFERGQAKMKERWTLWKRRPLKRAVEVYSMVIENQPFTANAAKAQYQVGLCRYTTEKYLEAAFDYRRVIEDYPGSDWVDEASYGLAMCYYDMSLPPEYDQTPSQLTIDAIDSFANRFPDDERLTGLRDKQREMQERIAQQQLINARFYEKRRRFSAAKIYYELVVDKYPESAAAAEARSWLDGHPGVRHIGDPKDMAVDSQ